MLIYLPVPYALCRSLSQFHVYLPWGNCLKWESASRGLLRDCEIFGNLRITFVSSSIRFPGWCAAEIARNVLCWIHQDHYKVVFCIRFNTLWNSRWLTFSSITFPSCELLAVGTKDQAIAATSRQLHNKSPAPAPSWLCALNTSGAREGVTVITRRLDTDSLRITDI